MDFQSVNLLNVRMNIISGNLFPMTTDSRFSIGCKIYSIIVWLIIISSVILFFSGFTMVSKEKVIADGIICIVFFIEILFMFIRIHTCRDLAMKLIQKINDILRVQDETMKCVMMTTLKIAHSSSKFYWINVMISLTGLIWISLPLIVIKKNSFYYEDYRVPFSIIKEPFSFKIFALGTLFLVIVGLYFIMKKAAATFYMMHLVLLITAQYRYIAVKLRKIFQEENSQKNKINSRTKFRSEKIDLWTEREMKSICRHYNIVIELSIILKKFLSSNFSIIYISNVLRLSFFGVLVTLIAVYVISFLSLFIEYIGKAHSKTLFERITIIMFAFGEMSQFYILCSAVQQLLDASTEITDMAFHEKWYQYGPSIKRTFLLMILSNNLKCKVATMERFSLSLPSFMTSINQAYSITLLCLKIMKK